MKRHAFAMEVWLGETAAFRKLLGEKWPRIVSFLDENRIHNFSLWECAHLVFGYCETEEDSLSIEGREDLAELCGAFASIGSWISEPGQGMRLMYHNFGIVRKNKELIRHRMFMTRLKPGCAEEYKKRHDALIEETRRNVVACERLGIRYKVGNVLSSDVFYRDTPNVESWIKMGVLAVEMEASALYMNAARAGKRALTICTISDHVILGEDTSPEEREKTFTNMMEVALSLI